MKTRSERPKKMCKNRAVFRSPLYISFKRRKTLGKSGVSSPARYEIYGKQRWGHAKKSNVPGEAQ